MGFYDKQILPRLIHLAMKNPEIKAQRQRTLADVSGDVLEIGFGSGLNLPYYGKNVRRLVGVDPSAVAGQLAKKAIGEVGFPVELVTDTAETFTAGATFDAVVSTFSLCTIPDAVTALIQARRALKPDGRLFFVEHGLAQEAKIQRWQHRLDPLQQWMCGGCHLSRDIRGMVEAAGFAIERLENEYLKGPKPMTYVYRGSAAIRAT